MLSRISRLSTMTSMIGGCPQLWDGQTAPKVAAKGSESNHQACVTHDHAFYCKPVLSVRHRSTSFGSDPFIGIGPSHEEHFSTLIDIDWCKTVLAEPAKSESPSEAITGFASGVYNQNCNASEAEDKLPWWEKFGQLSCESPLSERSECPTSLCVDDDSVELASKCVDWQAWDRYLSMDLEFNNSVKQELAEDFSAPSTIHSPSSELLNAACLLGDSSEFMVVKQECDDDFKPVLSDIFTTSIIEDVKPVLPHAFQTTILEEALHEKLLPHFTSLKRKKRGVKMKPRIDEATDRRRAMNREAAYRYRERKRKEQTFVSVTRRTLEHRNLELRKQERRLEEEIRRWKLKMADLN